ncbi:hypothetical protein D9M73_275470 [compost metagenome]
MAFEQHAQAKAIDAAVVGHNRQALDATAFDFVDEVFRDAAQTETAGEYSHVVGKAFKSLFVS